jgi:hypothetical protein
MLVCLGALLSMTVMSDGCSEDQNNGSDYQKVEQHAQHRHPYIPKNDVEFRNYNQAQELYDSPDTIIWCSTTWGNASAPLVTVPVTGKLTSSSTTYFSPEHWSGAGSESGAVVLPSRSVDGLFHPNPPQYRYGFTPGGQYVDFFNMPTFCTTALTKFQRQATKVTVEFDAEAARAQKTAEAKLRAGDEAGAQAALQEALGG